MRNNIKKDVLETIGHLTKIAPEEIDLEKNFAQTGLDSLIMVEIIFAFERKYEIDIPQESFSQIQTINDLIVLIKKTIKKHNL